MRTRLRKATRTDTAHTDNAPTDTARTGSGRATTIPNGRTEPADAGPRDHHPQPAEAESGAPRMTRLAAESVTLAYDQRVIAEELSVAVPDESFTVIVGPNACGKSTLLRALSRLLKPTQGRVLLDGQAIGTLPAKAVARTLGLLPQSSVAPDGITVSGLVARGRYPHQGLLRQWSAEDERIVDESMAATGIGALADRYVDELSGGQRQRVWIAMALAQQTPLLLLDEPTTFLDIQHQLDVLDLCADLHEQRGRTLVAVLHDLNQAARYATHLIAMREGRIEAQGPPAEIITAELVERVFGVRCRIIEDPESGTPLVVPMARRRAGQAAQDDTVAEGAVPEDAVTQDAVPAAKTPEGAAATAGTADAGRPAGRPGA
ncbi:iron complex transport system ATP-binding protein [Actinacidiphila alni]|uniref:Iron complex transport system ATP-binding protein n=2 Tax=Actinacidiphila alni TaxID=380248 RepID=A0A1I2MBL1_9ACTN|nr:iron complex transport system ATP-binding protein [Actinacidiphila alni]